MFINLMIAVMALSAVPTDSPPFEKVVVPSGGEHLVHFTNTWEHAESHWMVITLGAKLEVASFADSRLHGRGWLESGPYIWGVVDHAVYGCGYSSMVLSGNRYDNIRVGGSPRLIDDLIARDAARQNRAEEELKIIRKRMYDFFRRYVFEAYPLNEYIIERAGWDAAVRGEDTLAQNWDLSFDAIYRSFDQVSVVGARQGNLLVWELDRTQKIDDDNLMAHEPVRTEETEGRFRIVRIGERRYYEYDGAVYGNPDQTERPLGRLAGKPSVGYTFRPNQWTTREPVPTEVDSHFRILRAGEQLYLVDIEGRIYANIDETHRPIGSIPHWEGDSPVIVLEDQHDERIGFLRVSETGKITVLGVDWIDDDSFADDFLSELDPIESDELRAGLIHMAGIIRENTAGK